MAAHAAPAPGGRTLVIRGTPYPVLLPKLKDPRLHLAAVIISLQVLGQVAFDFRLSIAQILLSLLTCAVLEVGIAARTQHVLLWPASALLTGNGVAFILRVPGTEHGDWWSLHGWWIYVGTAAVSLLSKHVLQWRGSHVFNPSNFGLVLCFVLLGRSRAEPLDFWWGPMSWWMALALAIILAGGFAILSRLKLLRVALSFWVAFACAIGVLAATGHQMVARWHLGPIDGPYFWWVLVTSPEVLVFLFFMITDPKTAPRGPRARVVYAVALGLLGALLMAPTTTEYAHKVALLGALFLVCLARPVLELAPLRGLRPARRPLALAGLGAAAAAYVAVLAGVGGGAGTATARPLPRGEVPPITIVSSKRVESKLSPETAKLVAHDLIAAVGAHEGDRLRMWLEPGKGQSPPLAVASLAGRRYHLEQVDGRWRIANPDGSTEPVLASVPVLAGYHLTDVAPRVGLGFRHGAFRYGVTTDNPAMMGGGLCALDYDGDGWVDLFVVNSYGEGDIGAYSARGGLPRTALYRNDHGRFVDVSSSSGAARAVRGEGCVAADFNGDGHTDLYVTTAQSDELLWNDGNGRFTEGARSHGVVSYGWHSGAAVADVNGDGRPDLFVAGYTEPQGAIPGSTAGFPTNHLGVRDLLFLNLGNGHDGRARFREVGRSAGIDRAPFDHSLGALFTDVNADSRPDLYVANDEDPNRLYVNERGGPLGFRFVDRAREVHVADGNAGMGIAESGGYLVVSNSRRQTHAVYARRGDAFADVRRSFASAFGTNLTGWGDSWVDLRNDGTPELALANGAIPVTSLAKDAAAPQVLTRRDGRWVDTGILRDVRLNARGLAALDYDNDGRVDLAVNSIGGPLTLLHNTSRAGHWLEVRLARFAPGAVVSVTLPGGRSAAREVHAGSSYLSSEDPRVHFGLGDAARATVEVRWPGGKTTRLLDVPADRIVTVDRSR